MRKQFLLALTVLLLTAWAVAQQPGSTSPSAPAQGSSQPATPPSASDPTPPSAPSAGAMPGSQGSDVVEGCLGGTAPNFTVTDKAGTTYKLDIPASADTSILTRHLGESVAVMGALNDSGSKTGAAAGSSASSKSPTIAVQKIGRGSSPCSGAAGTAKPPTTK